MAGPIRTSTPSVAAAAAAAVQPPRPPNAWILYRSDKLRSLTPPPPGAPRRPQADISKTISALWKNETAEIRAHYERLSDIRKAEHQAMYPGYRFQPMKKADRERVRLEKKAEKERERDRAGSKKRSKSRPTMEGGDFPPPHFSFNAHFGPGVPTPPGQSPAAWGAPGQHPYPPYQQQYIPSGQLPTTHDFASRPPPAAPYPAEPHPSTLPPIVSPVPARPPSPNSWAHAPQGYGGYTSTTAPGLDWFEPSLEDGQEQDYLTIPLPNHSPAWGAEFATDALQTTLAPTSDPSMFHMTQFEPQSLFSHPGADIEIALPTSVNVRDFENANMFSSFNQLLFDGFSEKNKDESSPRVEAQEVHLDDSVDFNTDLRSNVEALALDAIAPTSTNPVPSSRPAPPSHSQSAPVVSTSHSASHQSYVPPAGAANSSSRRVGGNWPRANFPPPPPQTAQVWSGL